MASVCRHPNVSDGGGRKIRLVRRRRSTPGILCNWGSSRVPLCPKVGFRGLDLVGYQNRRSLVATLRTGGFLGEKGFGLVLCSMLAGSRTVNHGMKLKTTSQKETSAETGGATRDCETRPRPSGCLPFFPHDERCSASGRSLEENGGPRGQALSGNLELGWFSRPPLPSF